jgi:hypothetical protein
MAGAKFGERPPMKTFLGCVAFAIAVAFASQASALPCPNGTLQGHHYVCAHFNE